MRFEEKPNVTYANIGGCDDPIGRLREFVELPLIHPGRFVNRDIQPPKGVLLCGPSGTGKSLCARAIANRTGASFIHAIGPELLPWLLPDGAQVVRKVFEIARSKRACIVFFDQIDAIGATRTENGGVDEDKCWMRELIRQLDRLRPRGYIKVLMGTNRPDALDAALVSAGRMDHRVEFTLPNAADRAKIFRVYSSVRSVQHGFRYGLLARLTSNCTGADIYEVCLMARLLAAQDDRRIATEKDFLDAILEVIKSYAKSSPVPRFTTNNGGS